MMKAILILCLVSVFACESTGLGQVQSLEFGYGSTNNLTVPTGKLVRIHSIIGTSSGYWTSSTGGADMNIAGIYIQLPSGRTLDLSALLVSLGGTSSYSGRSLASSISSVTPNSPLLIPGPITITGSTERTTLLVYEIMDNAGNSSAAQMPSQGSSVVVPTSAAGDVDVKMEQSADNVTWTECLPGTYNSSTVKRFFRLRAVEK
jgi:hypothetical protein